MRDKRMEKFLDGHSGFVRGTISNQKPEIKTTLSAIIQRTGNLAKYLLTQRGCAGIIKRALRRGKNLPEHLEEALTFVAANGQPGNMQNSDQIEVARMRGFGDYEIGETFSALKARDYKDVTDILICPAVTSKWAKGSGGPSGDECQNLVLGPDASSVRRLTPMECERLQGFPDDWTRVPFGGKMPDNCSDTPRYKACGNSFAVPVIRWIGQRILLGRRSSL